MKLKKILALASALVLSVSVFASTAIVADAAVEGVTATLEFVGYEVKGATTFAKVELRATIPDTLVPYKENEPDWITTTDYSYEGKVFQGCGFDIPYVDGLTFVKNLSTVDDSIKDYVQINANATDKIASVYAANTSTDYTTYYTGEIGTLATLYYMVSDVNAIYNLELATAQISLMDFSAGTATPSKIDYFYDAFTITNATIKPEEPSVEVATSGAWDTGSGILVIGKVTGDATEKGITIAGYTLPEVSSDKGMGPNFVATAPASAQGYYGVYIAGIEAGTYTVNAYADTVTGATTTVTKN